jgi:hypothetical protein
MCLERTREAVGDTATALACARPDPDGELAQAENVEMRIGIVVCGTAWSESGMGVRFSRCGTSCMIDSDEFGCEETSSLMDTSVPIAVLKGLREVLRLGV